MGFAIKVATIVDNTAVIAMVITISIRVKPRLLIIGSVCTEGHRLHA